MEKTMASEADLMTINVTRRKEIRATSADLLVTIRGSSLVTGEAALKKAREVSQLVQDLTAFGLPAEAISLEGLFADVASGALLKNSQATYRLRIHCANIEALGELLGIVTSQKNATLEQIDWKFQEDDEQRDQWLRECLERAQAKARMIAASLGISLVGIHRVSDAYEGTAAAGADRSLMALGENAMRRTRAASVGEALGSDLSHRKEISIHVTVEYRIGGGIQNV